MGTINLQKAKTLYFIIYGFFSLSISGQDLRLQIKGKDSVETDLIESLYYIKNHSNINSLNKELDSVRNVFYKKGYIENKIEFKGKTNDFSILVSLDLKKKYELVSIYYDNRIITTSILKNISKNITSNYFEIPFTKIEEALQYLNTRIAQDGRPFSKIKLSNIEILNNRLKAALTVERDSLKRQVDEIAIKGYENFPSSYIKHYLKIKRNQIFNLEKLKRKTENLKNLSFANQIKPPEVLFTEDSTTLYLYIQKTKSNNFDGFLGFGTNEDSGNLQFDGYLNLSLVNNLNFGESFRLLYKSDEIDQKTFEANLTAPYLFKSPIGLDLQLYIFKRDSSFTNANQSAKLIYQLSPRHKILAGLNKITSNNLLSITIAQNIADYDATFFEMGYEYSYRTEESNLFPIRSATKLNFSFGKRDAQIISDNQSLIGLDAFKIFWLNQRNSLFTRINASSVVSDNYFENELLRFGGMNFIRGFEENSLYASLYGLANIEYRYLLSNAIYINTITDLGYFENKVVASKEKLLSVGFGFGVLTKAGLFRLIYANGKTEGQTFKFNNSKVHLNLSTTF